MVKCILCKKKERVKDESLFCEECMKKDVLIKIKALAHSHEFQYGIQRGKKMYSRLSTIGEKI